MASENRKKTAKPPRGRRFVKGQSGNPGGRPKSDHVISELAKEHTELALQTLVNICLGWRIDEDGERDYFPMTAGHQAAAAIALLDRGWGRPPQSIELSGEGLDLSLRVEIVKAPEGEA